MKSLWLASLRRCEFFRGIEEGQLSAVLGCLSPAVCSYARNETIAMEGSRLTGFGLLLTGEAIVTRETASGSRIILAVIGPGDSFGEVAAFAGHGTWPASVVAQQDTSAMFLLPDRIAGTCGQACQGHKNLVANSLRIISNRALFLNQRLEILTIGSLRGRISAYLLGQSMSASSNTFVMPLNREELADFLNVSRPGLSREMGRMREEGIIEFHRSSVRLLDIEALRASLS